MPQLMLQVLRSAPNPECISAAAHRAQARAAGSAGHTPGWRSARYSVMASESHTTVAPSWRQGTFPLGEMARKPPSGPGGPKGRSRSSKGMPRVRSSTHGRSDHDE